MALVAPVKDGKIVDTRATTEEKKKSEKSGNNLDKDAFLQLLVAQMKSGGNAEYDRRHEHAACIQSGRGRSLH